MNKIIAVATTVAALSLGTAASAYELGETGINLDNEVTLGYEANDGIVYGAYELNINKTWNDFTVYTEFDAVYANGDETVTFQGTEIGMEYQVDEHLELKSFGTFDSDFDNVGFHVEAVVKF